MSTDKTAEETGVLYKWRADLEQARPVRVACPDGLHPDFDAGGDPIDPCDHYETKKGAWDRLESEAAGWVRMTARDVVRYRADLAKAEQESGTAGVNFDAVKRNRAAEDEDTP